MNKTTTVRMMMMTAMMNLNDGLDFILSHFEKDTLWPRKISTKATDNHQKLVYNKEQALAWFKAANYLDCRINAYPDYTEYKGINRQAPNFIFAELDKSTFKTDRSLKIAYNKTMENFSSILGTSPTVISSGSGGFHFYQPVEAFVLEQQEFFLSKSANGEPSKEFIRFAELYLTSYKSDANHHPSFKSCMIRIPGSINSKCNKQVEIKQKWNGVTRPKINPLLYEFSRWLIYNRVNNRSRERVITPIQKQHQPQNNNNNYKITWIESLLQFPILLSDGRKYCLWRILAPYLMNVRKLSYEESFNIIKEWLDKCNQQVQRLDFNPNTKLKETLANVGSYYPIRLEKLKEDNKRLYDDIVIPLKAHRCPEPEPEEEDLHKER